MLNFKIPMARQNLHVCCSSFWHCQCTQTVYKLLKPILAFIRHQGIIVLTYIDDGFTTAATYFQCFQNIIFITTSFTVQDLAQVIGTLVSLFPACPLGRAHYHSLEHLKVRTLHASHDYSLPCSLDHASYHDLQWWFINIPHTAAPIARSNPSCTLFCDSSDYAWGSYFEGMKAQGFYTPSEKSNIIAVKEILAIYYGLRSFLKYFRGSHILI